MATPDAWPPARTAEGFEIFAVGKMAAGPRGEFIPPRGPETARSPTRGVRGAPLGVRGYRVLSQAEQEQPPSPTARALPLFRQRRHPAIPWPAVAEPRRRWRETTGTHYPGNGDLHPCRTDRQPFRRFPRRTQSRDRQASSSAAHKRPETDQARRVASGQYQAADGAEGAS
jgi:hypothetical protein